MKNKIIFLAKLILSLFIAVFVSGVVIAALIIVLPHTSQLQIAESAKKEINNYQMLIVVIVYGVLALGVWLIAKKRKIFRVTALIIIAFWVMGTGVSALTVSNNLRDIKELQKKEQVAQLTRTNTLPSQPTPAQPIIDSDPIITCNIWSQCGGPQKMRKSVCAANSFCCGFSDGNWKLYPDKTTCTIAQNAQAKPAKAIKNYIPPTYSPTIQTYSCTVSYPCTGAIYTYQLTTSDCSNAQTTAKNICSNSYSPTVTNTTLPSNNARPISQQAIQDCLNKFAALGTADSSAAQVCYTSPQSVPSSGKTCYTSWDEYFKAHPGSAYVAGLGSNPPCD